MSRITVAGAFDAKAEPFRLLTERLRSLGEPPITIDVGVFSGDGPGCDFPAAAVAEAAGRSLSEVREAGRAEAVSVMAEGAARIFGGLVEEKRAGGLACMGGSNAAVTFTRLAARAPIGMPKILMATVVAGETRPLAAAGDVILLYPVVDIEGGNYLLTEMIDRLAGVAAAAVRAAREREGNGGRREERSGRTAGMTMYGVTNRCVSLCRGLLAERGWESLVFHANGTGGRSLETFAAGGLVGAVLDVTTSELADELCGGWWPAGPDRLTAAARNGVPLAVAPGAMDMINFGPLDTVPARLRGRLLHRHNDLVTLVRTTPGENFRLGAEAARRLGDPAAPASILVPTGGFSDLDVAGGPFHDLEATAAFTEGVRSAKTPAVSLREVDCHINDPDFARAMVEAALPSPSPAED